MMVILVVVRLGLSSLHQGADALGAQNISHHASIFLNADRLQIGPEGPASRFLGPGTVATERRRFSTMRTLSHNATSFYNSGRECLKIACLSHLANSREILPQLNA